MSAPGKTNASGRFAGQGWIVTGGTRGIGLAVGRAAAAEGASVVVCARGRPADELGPNIHFVAADVAREADIDALFDRAEALLPGFDVVVNNAGSAHGALIVNTSLEQWQRVIAVNLRGPFLVCRRAVDELLASGGGRIVNVASFAAGGLVGEGAYAAAKAGLLSLTRTIAKEYGRANIRCNAVVPGFVDTDLSAHATSPERRAALAAATPLRRLASAAEVAAAILFLASDDAAFVQGDALPVTGGVNEALIG